jgi:hypothetical protein
MPLSSEQLQRIAQFKEEIPFFLFPYITAYNRLEPRPRSEDFDRSLRAEVHDALWMLTRQWQFGEFQGEDAASLATANILTRHATVDRMAFGGGDAIPYDETAPLETLVEQEVLPIDLSLRVSLGRQFFKMLAGQLDTYRMEYVKKFSLQFIDTEGDTEAAHLFVAMKRRLPDGYTLYQSVTDGTHAGWLAANAAITIADRSALTILASNFKTWVENWLPHLISQPDATRNSAWVTPQLEYQFALATPHYQQGQLTLSAAQYFQGRVDWYTFDLDGKDYPLDGEMPGLMDERDITFIPSPVAFKGMPRPRWWEMEENRTDFGKINAKTTGLLQLLLAEFGLVYGNDWFALPYPMEVNTLCEVQALLVKDVFGRQTLIRAAGKGGENNWQRWAMFHLAQTDGITPVNQWFYLAPTVYKILESSPIEKVNFLRDEMANIVWAVEAIIPSQAELGISGYEAAKRHASPESPLTPGEAKIRYLLGSVVPTNWIPFMPVHLPDNETEIRLQRAQMPTLDRPKGVVLSGEPPYFINEEEVPRTGISVSRSWQRTRWYDGKTFLWIGRRKTAGKGEGSSNLRFDRVEDI